VPNLLRREISPYLLQHADNPVHWHPWGDEAFALAREERKPVFLSIGYSACHWCHVMAHESFENEAIARFLNEHFVSVKVDREERPEVDQIYMEAVQMMVRRGGWPLSVFLTPQQQPFFGGTYWPARPQTGMPGFEEVLRAVAEAWRDRPAAVMEQARRMTDLLQSRRPPGDAKRPLAENPLEDAEIALAQTFDRQAGGFGPAPKFPRPVDLSLLLRRWRRSGRDDLLHMVTSTLDHMAAGGIYDQLGGGFHRYSVDGRWLVPHFEKMLYDNALLAGCYLDAWQATRHPEYARIVRQTLDYLLRDMTDPLHGFYSAEDADSAGEEGKFYVWTPEEIQEVLGAEKAETFGRVYDVTAAGNFEGRSILHPLHPVDTCAKMLDRDAGQLAAELADDRARLLVARARRVRPGRDDKVLTSWNGLLIDSLARAGAALDEPRYRAAAAAGADFLLHHVRDWQGRLAHCWCGGEARHMALLDDVASLTNALVTLRETEPQAAWLAAATGLADDLLQRFADPQQGGFFYTAVDHEPLIVRRKDVWDSAVPSGSGLAVTALLRLARHSGRSEYRRAAEEALRDCMAAIEELPSACGQLLLGLDMLLHDERARR
jgi:uncharacterized protein YyaL (SSP411 family)